jgi:hypothetical protein
MSLVEKSLSYLCILQYTTVSYLVAVMHKCRSKTSNKAQINTFHKGNTFAEILFEHRHRRCVSLPKVSYSELSNRRLPRAMSAAIQPSLVSNEVGLPESGPQRIYD